MKFSTTFRLAAGCAFWAAAAWAQQTVAPSRPMAGSPRSEANEPVWHDAPPAKTVAAPAAAKSAPIAPAAAPAPAPRGGIAALQAPANPLGGVLDVQADDLSYDAVRRLVIAKGNV